MKTRFPLFAIVALGCSTSAFGQYMYSSFKAWNGLCIDVPDYGRPPQSGDKLQVFRCHEVWNQTFFVRGTEIRLLNSNLCLDVPDFGRPPANHDYVQIFACNGGPNQRFEVRSDGTIRTWGGKCLDVPDYGRPSRDQDPLQIFDCHGGLNQRFYEKKTVVR